MEKTDEAAKARHRSEYQRAYRAGYKKRMKRVTLTMTLEEYWRLKRGADSARRSVATFAKDALSRSDPRCTRLPKETEEKFDELVRQVRGVATNVNQMAKRSNGLRIPGDAQEVMFRLRSIEDAVRRFLSGAGLGW